MGRLACFVGGDVYLQRCWRAAIDALLAGMTLPSIRYPWCGKSHLDKGDQRNSAHGAHPCLFPNCTGTVIAKVPLSFKLLYLIASYSSIGFQWHSQIDKPFLLFFEVLPFGPTYVSWSHAQTTSVCVYCTFAYLPTLPFVVG